MNNANKFPKEIEEGNIEYKRQINNLVGDKLTKFQTQMLWRISEGRRINSINEAIYYIGIDDDGSISGENMESINSSLVNLLDIVAISNCELHSTKIEHSQHGTFAIINIRKINDYTMNDEIKVGLLGSSNTGKTTFLGTITYNILDDGNGSARSNILHYDHEKQSGITTSIKYEIIGYNDTKCINYTCGFIGSWENIVKNSKKIISFIDLPGNSKFIKTTLFGLMAHRPDYALIFISLIDIYDQNTNNIVLNDETKLHIDLCVKLHIKFGIVLTKKDMFSEINTGHLISKIRYALEEFVDDPDIPIIPISNVSGENLDLVKKLLNNINIRKINKRDKDVIEFMINDVTFIHDVGTVTTGILNQGKIKVGNKLLIGPINKTFFNIEVISIHKKQIPCKHLYEGEIGSLVVRFDNKINISKYMMIFTANQLHNFTNKFSIIVKKNNYIQLKKDLSLMIMCGNVYDSINIIDIIPKENDDIILYVAFQNNNIQFIKNNEYVAIRYNNNIIIGNIIL